MTPRAAYVPRGSGLTSGGSESVLSSSSYRPTCGEDGPIETTLRANPRPSQRLKRMVDSSLKYLRSLGFSGDDHSLSRQVEGGVVETIDLDSFTVHRPATKVRIGETTRYSNVVDLTRRFWCSAKMVRPPVPVSCQKHYWSSSPPIGQDRRIVALRQPKNKRTGSSDVVPSTQTIALTENILEFLRKLGIEPIKVAASDSGAVLLRFAAGTHYVHIEVLNESTMVVAAHVLGEPPAISDFKMSDLQETVRKVASFLNPSLVD